MSWLATIVIAVLTATIGTLASGYVANLAVGWYRISGFEGGSGYFVVGMALLGLIGGLVVGVVVSRLLANGSDPSALKAMGLSLATVLFVVGVIGGTARLLADVPPEIDGEQLMLVVEARWPLDQKTSPALEPGEAFLEFGSVNGSRVRRNAKRGALWKEDARLVDGRWVVPGAVEVYTSRGARVLDIALNEEKRFGFLVPLPGRPGKKELEWSGWGPLEGRGGPPRDTGVTYRYKVQPRTAPVRTEVVGPFEISTIAYYFTNERLDDKTSTIAAGAEFSIRHRGKPVVIEGTGKGPGEGTARFDVAAGVSLLPGTPTALLVHLANEGNSGQCYLLSDEDEKLRVQYVAPCPYSIDAAELTSDNGRFHTKRAEKVIKGRIDRTRFDRGAIYLLGNAVLDTRRRTVHHFANEPEVVPIPSVPPLGISPDERSVVRFVYADGQAESQSLLVTDVVADRSYLLPVDPLRMRYAKLEKLDPAWVAHHFEWRKGADGADRLIERAGFVPLPYRGELTVDDDGRSRYWIEPAGQALRAALVDFVVKEFKAVRTPVEATEYTHPVHIDGRLIQISASGDFGFVSVTSDYGTGKESPDQAVFAKLVAEIAKRFNAELATGKYDAMFSKPTG